MKIKGGMGAILFQFQEIKKIILKLKNIEGFSKVKECDLKQLKVI